MIRNLYTQAGLLIARGYDRVVDVGDRGPYVECNHEQIVHDSIRRIHAVHYYFDEYRSNCESNVMVELQRMPVSDADYVVGKYYISPSDLRDESGQEVPELFVDPSKRQGSFPF
jgi:hypothetical protein